MVRRIYLPLTCFVLALSLFMLRCANTNGQADALTNADTGFSAPEGTILSEQFRYIARNDTLNLTSTSCFCDDSIAETKTVSQAYSYTLSENTLELTMAELWGSDSLSFGSILMRLKSVEIDSLSGTWSVDLVYSSITGTLTQEETDELNKMLKWEKEKDVAYLLFAEEYKLITYRWIDSTETFSSYSRLTMEDHLNELYHVTMDVVNDSSYRLIGMATHDTVVTTINSNGNVTYVSTDPDCPAHVYFNDKTICPNPYHPHWLDSVFLRYNIKYIDSFIKNYRDTLTNDLHIKVTQTSASSLTLVNLQTLDSVFISEDTAEPGTIYFSSSNPSYTPYIYYSNKPIDAQNIELKPWFRKQFLPQE